MQNLTRFATVLAAGAVFAFFVPSASAQVPSAMEKAFLVKLCQGNHAEIAASKIALKNSNDPKVRGVAQTIITEHTANEQKLQTLAAKYSVKLPNVPDAKHKALAKRLAMLKGDTFDNAYITAQMKDHHATIALLRKQMEVGKNSDVRSFATETLGAVQAHTDKIHQVSGTSPNAMGGMKIKGTLPTPRPVVSGGTFTPQPRVSPTVSTSPAPGIN